MVGLCVIFIKDILKNKFKIMLKAYRLTYFEYIMFYMAAV